MKKCAVIYNPHSGKNIHDNFIPNFIKILNDYGYDVDFNAQFRCVLPLDEVVSVTIGDVTIPVE